MTSIRRALARALEGLPHGTFVPAAAFVFLGMAGSVLLRSYGDALFLDLAGISQLPRLLVVSALVLSVLSAGYFALVPLVSPVRLDRVLLAASALACAGPAVLGAGTPAAAFWWALTFSIVSSLANIIAWSWATAAIDARTAKRAMPLLGAAGTAGAVIFGAIVPTVVRGLGTGALATAALAVYGAMAVLPSLIERRGTVAMPGAARGDEHPATPTPSGGRALAVALVAYGLLEAVAGTIADFQLKAAAESLGGRERIAEALGLFHGISNAGVLVLQVGVVGNLLARFGIQVGLFAGPAAMGLATVSLLVAPGVMLAAGPKMVDAILKFSFGRSAREVAFAPLGNAGQRRAKVLVRGIAGPVGGLIGGGLLLVTQAGAHDRAWVGAAILGVPVIALWLVSARFLLRSYLATLQAGLRIRGADLLAQTTGAGALERAAEDHLLTLVLAGSPSEVAFASDILVDALGGREAERLCRHTDPRIRAIAWLALGVRRSRRRLLAEVARPEIDAGVRERILGAFAAHGDDRLTDEAGRWRAGGGAVALAADVYLGTVGRLTPGSLARVAHACLQLDGRAGAMLRGALGRGSIGEADALALLVAADGAVPANALRSLVAFGTPAALREVVGRAEGAGLAAAARALVEAPRAVAELVRRQLGDAPAPVRERIARALGAAPDAAASLGFGLLCDPDPSVRAATARSLTRLMRTVAGLRPPQETLARAVAMEIALGTAYRHMLTRLEGRQDAGADFARTEIALRLTRVAERLFQVLALGGDARTLGAALRRFHSGKDDARRTVLTLLEDLPSTPLRARAVAYLEGRVPADPDDSAAAGDIFLARCLTDDEELRRLRPRIDLLRSTTLFAGLGGEALVDLAVEADEIDVAPGEVVVRQGDEGDTLYAIMIGELRFEKDGEVVGRARAGRAFGELAVIDGARRSATAIAASTSRLLRVPRRSIDAALERHPDLWQGVARSLARWIREHPASS